MGFTLDLFGITGACVKNLNSLLYPIDSKFCQASIQGCTWSKQADPYHAPKSMSREQTPSLASHLAVLTMCSTCSSASEGCLQATGAIWPTLVEPVTVRQGTGKSSSLGTMLRPHVLCSLLQHRAKAGPLQTSHEFTLMAGFLPFHVLLPRTLDTLRRMFP